MALKFTQFLIITFLLLLNSACGTLSTVQFDSNDFENKRHANSHNLKAEVDELAEPLVSKGHTPGVIVGVLTSDGSEHFFSYGVANQTNHSPPDADTLFPIGSISKGFMGAMTAMLVREGTLSWDATLNELLPQETSLSHDAQKITLLQLATHTSGLPRQPMTFQTMVAFIKYLFTGESFYQHFNQEYLFNYLEDFSAPQNIEPRYSNIGYGLLGYILESRSKKSLEELFEEKISRVLHLNDTGYNPDNLLGKSNRAFGYAGDQPKFIRRGAPVPDWSFTPIMKGSAAMHSTARDLLKFAKAHFCEDNSPFCSSLRETLKVRFPRDSRAAATAWIEDTINEQKITYQVGLVAGYTSYIGLDVKNGNAVVVLQNSFNWGFGIGHRLLLRMAPESSVQTVNFVN